LAISRGFRDFCSNVLRWANREGNPFGKQWLSWGQALRLFIFPISREFLLLSNVKYLVQTYWLRIEHSQERQLFVNRGDT
jgi:hypothetical protein